MMEEEHLAWAPPLILNVLCTVYRKAALLWIQNNITDQFTDSLTTWWDNLYNLLHRIILFSCCNVIGSAQVPFLFFQNVWHASCTITCTVLFITSHPALFLLIFLSFKLCDCVHSRPFILPTWSLMANLFTLVSYFTVGIQSQFTALWTNYVIKHPPPDTTPQWSATKASFTPPLSPTIT